MCTSPSTTALPSLKGATQFFTARNGTLKQSPTWIMQGFRDPHFVGKRVCSPSDRHLNGALQQRPSVCIMHTDHALLPTESRPCRKGSNHCELIPRHKPFNSIQLGPTMNYRKLSCWLPWLLIVFTFFVQSHSLATICAQSCPPIKCIEVSQWHQL